MLIAEDQGIAWQRLTRLAVAMKLHRLEEGACPDSLKALCPDPLEELPPDPFTGEHFRYERRGKGFLLYSLGRNGEDDGGSDANGELIDGD